MALFQLKSLSQQWTLANVEGDRSASVRAEQFRVSDEAIYFPAFPGDRYLPFDAVTKILVRNKALPVTGTCGKALPMICLRAYYDGEEFYKDFLFEKKTTVDQVLERIRTRCPDVPVDQKLTPVI